MSAWGQSRPNRAPRAMSAFPPIATVQRTSWLVRFVPISLRKSATKTARVANRTFDGVVLPSAAPEAGNCFRCPWVTQDLRKVLLCNWRRSHQEFGEPPEVLSDSSQRELKLSAPWAP
jgi:hypothetical protein